MTNVSLVEVLSAHEKTMLVNRIEIISNNQTIQALNKTIIQQSKQLSFLNSYVWLILVLVCFAVILIIANIYRQRRRLKDELRMEIETIRDSSDEQTNTGESGGTLRDDNAEE